MTSSPSRRSRRARWSDALASLPSTDLAELDAAVDATEVAGPGRFDRKFLVPRPSLAGLAGSFGDGWSVLEVDGRRSTRYETTYFDTEDLLTFRLHRQGRRRRFKIRARRYATASGHVLEVKLRDGRGRTTKHRLARHGEVPEHLVSVDERAVVDEALAAAGILSPAATLVRSLTTSYERTTLVHVATGERVTVDLDLAVRPGDRSDGVMLGEHHAVVEAKTPAPNSATHRVIRAAGGRPARVSKYCIGLAATHPKVAAPPWRRTLRQLTTPNVSMQPL